MFDTADFDLGPYADLEMTRFVRRTYCSYEESGWRSLLVQRFAHAQETAPLPLPGVADLHLVLCTSGAAEMRTHSGGRAVRRRWTPGLLELMIPGRPVVRGYRATAPLGTLQVHVPRATVEQAAAELGGPAPDFEALAAGLGAGDPVLEHLVRALPAAARAGVGDAYAESAAAFLATHLLSQGREQRAPGRARTAVERGIEVMHDRLADPLTLAEIAAEAHLSVYQFIRVFRAATGETPHRYLTRLRIERARTLLTGTDTGTGLTVAQIAARCGFASPGSLSSAFLKQVGTRPSAYRAAYREGERERERGARG